MKFLKPSDIVTVRCEVSHVTRSGSAFAVDSNGESVYIPVRFVEQSRIDIGDGLVCYCVDQELEEHRVDAPIGARYRAVRLKIENRLNDILPGSAASDALIGGSSREESSAPPVVVKEVNLDDARNAINSMFAMRRAWTVSQIIDEIKLSFPGTSVGQEMQARISAWIDMMHDIGTIASCTVSKSKNDAASVTWYAAASETFVSLIDDYELEE